METANIDYQAQQPLQYTQPLAVANSRLGALQYDLSQAIAHIPQANAQGPEIIEYEYDLHEIFY